jgi:dTDP-4-amino-4,6-dideoxygalactose transaminase
MEKMLQIWVMFSFHATKVFNTVEGGGLTFADDALCKEFAAIRQFGMYGKEDAEMLGTNAKMTEFHAAMGLCNLRHVLEEINKRKMAYERYIERLTGVEGIYICPQKENVSYNYAYFPVRFNEEIFGKSRDQMANELIQNGIVPRKYFYPLTSDFTIIKEKFVVQDTPIAGKIADEILTLPLYAGLSEEEVDRICDIVMK